MDINEINIWDNKLKNEKKININVNDIITNQDKSNKVMDTNKINIYDEKILKNIVVIPNDNNDDNNNIDINNEYDDYYDLDNNIPSPMVSKSDVLIDNGTDDFEKFKNKILSDKSIDSDMKQILIKSRMEEIEKFNTKSKNNIENAIRSGLVSPLIYKLKDIQYKKINDKQKGYLINQIEKWTDGKIHKIKLESEILYELNELIDLIKSVRIDIDEIKIKNIFEPKNVDDYICFMDTIEIIKAESIKEEQERINKKIEKKRLEEEQEKKRIEEEEKKQIQIKFRQDLLEIIIINLNKLSSVDSQTKNLKNELELPIGKFIGLESNFIELEENLSKQLIKFINSIRIIKENKESIINLIKIIM